MDFELTDEQKDIQKAAQEFAKGEFDPDYALDCDRNGQFPSSIWKKACELGFIGIQFPEEYGGPGLGLLENALIVEAFCRKDSGIGMALGVSDFGSEMILRNGDENQKKTILSFVAKGKGIITIACLEKGHHVEPLAAIAEKNKNQYIINGQRSFVTLGSIAKYIIVQCQTKLDDPCLQSAILLERETEGLEISNMGEKVGMRMIPLSQVSLSNVRVPEQNRIGVEDQGVVQLRSFLNEARIESAAMGVGIAQGALDRASEYSQRRIAFGKTIVNFGAIRNKLVDMYLEVEMARLMTYRAAWSFDHGRPDDILGLVSKIVSSETAYRVTYDAVQTHGGCGYMEETDIVHFYRDAEALGLFLEPAYRERLILADQIYNVK